MSYSLRVLDLDRSVIAVLDRISEPTYSRRKREATTVTVSVPRGDQKLSAIQRGRYLEVWRGAEREASGRIELRDVTPGQPVSITAYTEEILLKDFRTPAQYGAVFAGMDVSDVVKACLDRWHVTSVKTVEQWNGPLIERIRVEARDAAGGTLWLTRDGSGKYHRNGYAIYHFNIANIPGFKRWDRIRWASDYPPDSAVFTTVQYRYGTSGPWLPDVSWPSCTTEEYDDCTDPQTLSGERGVLTDQVGLPLSGSSGILQVRVNLYSDDQESQEEDEEGTSGSSPRFYALEVIARTESNVTIGSIPAETGVIVQGISADSAPAFDVIRQATEQADIDFEVSAGQCSIAEAFGPDLTGELNLVTSEVIAPLPGVTPPTPPMLDFHYPRNAINHEVI